jgi:hypothetical protein
VIRGLFSCLAAFATGAVLNFVVAVNPSHHGFTIQTAGLIIMGVAGAGVFLTALALATEGDWRRYQAVVPQGRASLAGRDDRQS